jgi:hypothetical protein
MSTLGRAALALTLTIGFTVAAAGTAAAAGTPDGKTYSAKGGGAILSWADRWPNGVGSTTDADDVILYDTREDGRGVWAKIEHPKGRYTEVFSPGCILEFE